MYICIYILSFSIRDFVCIFSLDTSSSFAIWTEEYISNYDYFLLQILNLCILFIVNKDIFSLFVFNARSQISLLILTIIFIINSQSVKKRSNSEDGHLSFYNKSDNLSIIRSPLIRKALAWLSIFACTD